MNIEELTTLCIEWQKRLGLSHWRIGLRICSADELDCDDVQATIKISLETGEVCSYESKGYIFNHIKRDNITPKITMDEARNVIKQKEYILSEGLAIIPTDFNTEILVYEFKGKIDETEFLVYINANTAAEEKVLLILNTPGGILTI